MAATLYDHSRRSVDRAAFKKPTHYTAFTGGKKRPGSQKAGAFIEASIAGRRSQSAAIATEPKSGWGPAFRIPEETMSRGSVHFRIVRDRTSGIRVCHLDGR